MTNLCNRKAILVASLLGSLLVSASRTSNAQPTPLPSQDSSASIDKQKSDEARKVFLRVGSSYFKLKAITSTWEKTVDAAGLHTLLNQNQKAYTLFKPHFDGMDTQACEKKRAPDAPIETSQEFEIRKRCRDAIRGHNGLSKLFKIENQKDLQRIVKCHVVPKKILLKDLPNDQEVTFNTMEPGCTITMRAKHFQEPERITTQENSVSCNGFGDCRSTGSRSRSSLTGKTIDLTSLVINMYPEIWLFRTNEIPKGIGNYIEYDKIGIVLFPADLKDKYTGKERPLTD